MNPIDMNPEPTNHHDQAADHDEPTDPRIERSRAAVMEAAACLMHVDGPDAITHARVATAAGVSRTTVYKHYPERADLLRATIEAIGKSLPDPDSFTGVLGDDLITLLTLLATDLRDDAHTTLMLTMLERARHDEEVAAVRNVMLAEIEEAFRSLVAPAIDRGDLRGDLDPTRALASLGGALLFFRFLGDRPIDDELLASVVDDFVRTNAPR